MADIVRFPSNSNGVQTPLIQKHRGGSSVTGWHVSGKAEVCPFEAMVVAQVIHEIHQMEAGAKVKLSHLSVKVNALDFSLYNNAVEMRHHLNIWAEAGYPHQTPYTRKTVMAVVFVAIFGAEIGINADLLSGYGLDEAGTYLAALGIAASSFSGGKALSEAIQRFEKTAHDKFKEGLMIAILITAIILMLLAMSIARTSYAAQAELASSASVGLMLLQAGFFLVATCIGYLALPRDRIASDAKSACMKLKKQMEKLLKSRAKLSARFNKVHAHLLSTREQRIATGRYLIAEYWQAIHLYAKSNAIGTPAVIHEASFPPCSVGEPFEAHPASLEQLLNSVP